jgi:molybdopterin synthase sulfur carrier subunit
MLAAEAGGQKRFELEAGTVGEALRQLPIANLLFDEAGDLRRLINVFVDGVDARGGRGLDEPLSDESEVRVVGAVAGGDFVALSHKIDQGRPSRCRSLVDARPRSAAPDRRCLGGARFRAP